MKLSEYSTMRECEDRHWWYGTLRAITLAELHQRVPRGAEVLDAGCGTGGMMARLVGWKATGVDASSLAVRHCHERGLKGVLQASVNALPFHDASFDAALCLDVLYHQQVDPSLALAELARVVKPEGTVIFNHAAFNLLRGSHDDAVHGRRRYTAAQARAELAQGGGLRLEHMHYWNAWLFLPLMLWRTLAVAHVSDVKLPCAMLNRLLASLCRWDARLCRRLGVPWGTSLFIVARVRGSASS